jgi:hypothetical protein
MRVQDETKICVVCGRIMEWRKAWAKNWAEVKYCSDSCRRAKNDPNNEKLDVAILELLANRADAATICPSEAARMVGGEAWQDLMQPARDAARRLVDRGEVEITQKGKVVDGSMARGPIRIRKV